MALCLSRNFRSCSSFVFVSRRSQHSNSLELKTTNSISPLAKEMAFWDHSVIVPRSYENNSKAMSNLQVFSGNVLGAQECKAYKRVENETDDNLKRADRAQLQHVASVLIEDLPELFNRNMNYKIYHPKMSFENNIRGTKTIGVFNYMREMFILKMIGNIRFSQVKFTILKITDHPEDGTVRVRWRIVGISQLKNILRMLKQISQKNMELEGWYDGFSIFYVRSDGLIHRHIVDKERDCDHSPKKDCKRHSVFKLKDCNLSCLMIPDSSDEEKFTSLRNHLAAKMAFAVGVSVKEFSFEELQNKSPCLSKVTYSLEVQKPSFKVKFSECISK